MLSEVVLYISPDIASAHQIKQRHLCVYMTCGDGVIKFSKFKLTFFHFVPEVFACYYLYSIKFSLNFAITIAIITNSIG